MWSTATLVTPGLDLLKFAVLQSFAPVRFVREGGTSGRIMKGNEWRYLMFQDIAMAGVLAAILVIVGSVVGVFPVGAETLEEPWKITATLLLGIVLGASTGFTWLDGIQREKGTSFPWQLLLVTFAAGGICVLEYLHGVDNGASINSPVLLVAGGISAGSFLGALVRTL